MSSGFLYIAACVRILLLFKAKYYSMVYIPRCVCTACSRSILLSLDVGVTSTFRILSVILLWTGVRNIFSKSSSPLEGRRLLGSDGNSSFNFLKALHAVSHSSCPISYSHERCTRVLISARPWQHLTVSTPRIRHASYFTPSMLVYSCRHVHQFLCVSFSLRSQAVLLAFCSCSLKGPLYF